VLGHHIVDDAAGLLCLLWVRVQGAHERDQGLPQRPATARSNDALVRAANCENGRVNWSGLTTWLTEVDEALATVLERLRADATPQQASDPPPAPSLESLEDCRSPDALLHPRRLLQRDSRPG
jgi:hypothetical protein